VEKVRDNKEKKLITLSVSLFFLYHFIKGNFFFESQIFEVLYLNFGVYYYFLIAYPLLISYSFFMDDNKKIMVLKTRLFFTILFFFFCTLLIVVFQLRGYNLQGVRLEKQLIKISWIEDELGGFSTMLIYFLYFNLKQLHLYLISGLVIAISSFFIFGSSVKEFIKSIINIRAFYINKRKLIEREKELEAKINIKESIEKEILIKKEKYTQEKERKIREKVKEVLEEDTNLNQIEYENTGDSADVILEENEEKQEVNEETELITEVTMSELTLMAESQKEEYKLEKEKKLVNGKDEDNDIGI
jgi:hypothetical protein